MRERGIKILIVEDDPVMGETLVKLFQKTGHIAKHVLSGEEALREPNRDYSLIITDLVMPGMDRLVLLKEAEKRYEENDEIRACIIKKVLEKDAMNQLLGT